MEDKCELLVEFQYMGSQGRSTSGVEVRAYSHQVKVGTKAKKNQKKTGKKDQ